MEIKTTGNVLVTAKIENLQDLFESESGTRLSDDVRTVEVADALIDTGAVMLSMPTRFINQLGLRRHSSRRVRTVAGVIEISICNAVRLTIQDRECTLDVAELPDDCPVLIGQIPLEALDFVVDPCGQKLIGNPEHGGEQMIEIL